MGLIYQNILGIRVTTSPKEKILEEIKKWLNFPKVIRQNNGKTAYVPWVIATPNPEQIMLARWNSSFKEMLNQADVTIPDGIGVVWASRFLFRAKVQRQKSKVMSRISGVDFMQDLVKIATEQRVRVGLIGGLPGLAVKALECLRVQNPRLEGWAEEGPEIMIDKHGDVDGPGPEYWAGFAKRIVSTKTQIVFVGLGAPKQEYAMHRLAEAISVLDQSSQKNKNAGIVLMAVGGSFDMIAGRRTRAPLVIRSIGFEWLWRLFQDPWRWRRQVALVRFVWAILHEKIARI